MTAPAERDKRVPLDRRARRRAETIAEILDRAVVIMSDDGVAGLTMSGLARAMSIQPPSLYKYFPSVNAVHDALYRRGQEENLAVLRAGMACAEPGLPALRAGLTALGRWAVANPVLAQLLFWRPVPGFRPSPDAFAAADEVVELLRGGLRDAVAAGQLGPAAASERGLHQPAPHRPRPVRSGLPCRRLPQLSCMVAAGAAARGLSLLARPAEWPGIPSR